MATIPDISPREQLPEPTLSRLPWYLAYVNRLADAGIEYVSSTAISRQINVEASQIAKDLSYLGIKGKTRIGYNVADLAACLERFLGFRERHRAVMAGVGSLGSALIADRGLERFGLEIVAGIDTDPAVAGTVTGGVKVYAPDEMKPVVRKMGVEIGIIAVPVDQAQQVADELVAAGVHALWNFTPCRILCREGIVVQDTSIYAHLAVMYNRLSLINSTDHEGDSL
ncbi:MAG: redox-sensing transcriptional repressor Rex [Candidatus Amulumruptor caecigallinarius]|nr:redox-sensing transcriptional repressor Rex [Candidatus Amulumruptor caecigallinarius]MCM1397209.1 redox-sensing transcriptional repressor Rex [Candidatus Amulumruptor caecigallinarius]MCM1453102.1 redox-sensing transcriptional repressor Rex [bacterium]